MSKNPIGAYAAAGSTGWSAYDKEGHAWPVEAKIADGLEADRMARNANKGKLPS
ncbi:MAG: hypothetical protein P1U53_16565 [Sulfitobacter sp.]|nr:hypothetical protein [Sulfitobacter sp.]